MSLIPFLYVQVYTRCDQKITVILKFCELFMFCDFRFFFSIMLVQYQPFWIVSLFLTDKMRLIVVWCVLHYFTMYSKKWIKETVLRFV